MPDNNKIAIFAGRGQLPGMLIDHFKQQGREFSLFLLEGEDYEVDYSEFNPLTLPYGEVGRFLAELRKQEIKELVFVGGVNKPHFSSLKVDKKGAALVARILANKILGDDAVLRSVIKFFEKEGLKVVPVNQFLTDLAPKKSTLSKVEPSRSQLSGISIALKAIKTMSPFDIGQSVIVAQQQIIAVEALEGTDKMIARCKDLTVEYKDEAILVKLKKDKQSSKADLPTIGVETVKNCHDSGIKGIAIQAGATLIVDKAKVIELVDELGMFLVAI